MKQYVIDGFTLKDYTALKQYFDTYLEAATVGGIYWLELDSGVLTETQASHKACGPHVFALMLEEDALFCELLVRIKTNIRCDCMGSATGWLTGQTPFLKSCPFVFDIGSG